MVMIYSKTVLDRFTGIKIIGYLYDAKNALKIIGDGGELTTSGISAIHKIVEMLQLAIAFCDGRNEVSVDQIDGGSAFALFASTENALTLEQLKDALMAREKKFQSTLKGETADVELLLEWLTRSIQVVQAAAIEESIGFKQAGWRL